MAVINSNVKWLLILLIAPPLILTGIGWLLYFKEFNYINEYVIACGPIYSGFVALYVAQFKQSNENERQIQQRNATTEYLVSLIQESIEAIRSEMNHYEELVDEFSQHTFEEKSLRSTSFHHLNKIEELYNDDLYRSIIHRQSVSNSQELSIVFRQLLNAINNAIFLKDNATNQFENYIKVHNKYAQIWVNAQMSYSELDANLRANPSGDPIFDYYFLLIINSYNQGINKGTINSNKINSYRGNLVIPLNQLAQKYVHFYHPYLLELVKTNHEAIRSLDKMEEFQNQMETHLRQLHSDLGDTREILRSCSNEIEKTI